jgi:ATP-dependent RNA helicase DeaD
MPHEVQDIVKHYMKHPEKVKVQTHVDKGKLIQHYYNVNSRDKFSMLMHIMTSEPTGLKIIFCATRNRVDIIGRNLSKNGIRNERLHGGLSQNKRKQAIDAFHHGQIDVLVASDVAARGLDIKNVSHIINYDLPKNSKEYIHRIGRTARAGTEGKVISLLSNEDHDNFRSILDDRSIVVERLELPEFKKVEFSAKGHQDRDEDRSDRGPRRSGFRPGGGRFGGNRFGRPRPGGYSQRPHSGSSHREGSRQSDGESSGDGNRSHSRPRFGAQRSYHGRR